MYIKPQPGYYVSSAEPITLNSGGYLICKSTKESILKTPIYKPLYTTGSSQ